MTQLTPQDSTAQVSQPDRGQGSAPVSTTPARWALLIAVSGLVIALDQIVKWLVETRLAPGQSWEPIPAIASFIKITYSYNSGAAFGMLPQASDVFLLLALVTIVAFVISYPRLPSHAWLSRLSIGLISGGALSNAIDRLRLGRVVDYVNVQLTPTFSNISNFADHAITVGVILLLIDQWLAERNTAASQPAAAMPSSQVDPELTTPSVSDKL